MYINNTAYLVFTVAEEALHCHINRTDTSLVNIKDALPIVRYDEDVLFHWAVVPEN